MSFTEGGLRGPLVDRFGAVLGGENDNHRSVYLPVIRDRVPESLEVFDFAEPAFVTGRRDATNVPTQALYLMNSAEIARMAEAFAARVMRADDGEAGRIVAAFEIAFGRRATAAEVLSCRDFLRDFREAAAKDAAKDAAKGQAASLRDRARARMRGDAPARNAADPERLAWSALCQALFLSAEFRTVD